LREGGEVELAGVHIGKIEKVRLLPPDSPEDARVEAIMLIDQKLDGKPDYLKESELIRPHDWFRLRF
jgi:hypothetical protein